MDTLISLIAQYAVFLSLVITAIVWLRLSRQQKWEFAVTGVVGGVVALAFLKLGGVLYFDPRPFVTEHIALLFPHAPDKGFPSDHTLLGMFLAMCVLFYSRKWGAVPVVIAIAIGVARVEAHVHHPIDILAASPSRSWRLCWRGPRPAGGAALAIGGDRHSRRRKRLSRPGGLGSSVPPEKSSVTCAVSPHCVAEMAVST